jgi:glycosyltransferase involved in cell wall biosynthesis
MAAPFVSIVTVTFNAAAHLVPTIESVLAQTHRPLEYVIVDGGSTDGTVDIIKRYEKHLARWVSEPDRGIYDAMNQSLGLVQGEWVNFMNAGDVFASPESVAGALVGLPAGAEVVYGSYDLAYRTFHKHKPAPADLSGLVWGMAVNHQSVFVRTGVARAHPFDLGYPLAADFGQLLGLYRAGAKFHRADQTVARFADGGVSAARKAEYLRQCLAVAQRLYPEVAGLPGHYARAIGQVERVARLQRLLPAWLFEGLMWAKYQLRG